VLFCDANDCSHGAAGRSDLADRLIVDVSDCDIAGAGGGDASCFLHSATAHETRLYFTQRDCDEFSTPGIDVPVGCAVAMVTNLS
jgi:hypothetical protein